MKRSASNIKITEPEPGIALLTIDMPGSRANILTRELFRELDEAMAELSERTDLEGLIVISGKPTIFVAGADLHAIAATLDWSDDQIIQWCEQGRSVMARFSRCPFVTVAAIHGACAGGGLELPLWCDCRTATNDPRTRLGLPEVKLGLVPGWGGTARLPRIAGFAAAAELIASGRLLPSNEALELGIVDAVVDPSELMAASIAMIRRVHTSRSFVQQRRAIMGPVSDLSGVQETVNRLAARIISDHEIFPFAPTVALEHLARTAALDQPAAWKSESLAMCQVYGSPANRGLLNHFMLVDRNKKQPGLVDLTLTPNPIQTVGIVGAGLMGRSIAEACLGQGISVLIYDAAAGTAAEFAAADHPQAQPGAAITAIENYSGLTSAELVIESVVETLPVKTQVLEKISAAVSAETLIASNTSAIPISKLAAAVEQPDRFCGIHFCHPELMSLVEVVCGSESSEAAIAKAVRFVQQLKKMPVALNDGPGFVVNRLLAAMLDQSIRILLNGSSIEEIDGAMREFGFLGGPFEIIDVIGADTCMYAGRTMWEAGLQCVSLAPILPRFVKLGRLGRKTGTGFYRYPDYPDLRGQRQSDPEAVAIIDRYRNGSADKVSSSDATTPSQKIVTQILSVMVLEATRILSEQIVADFRDLDLCVIHGFSFPQHRGGILFWADDVGLETVTQTLAEISANEPRLEPNEMLKSRRDENRSFYDSKY